MAQDVRDCHPSLVSILGLELSTLGFCRNHMLGIGTCTICVVWGSYFAANDMNVFLSFVISTSVTSEIEVLLKIPK